MLYNDARDWNLWRAMIAYGLAGYGTYMMMTMMMTMKMMIMCPVLFLVTVFRNFQSPEGLQRTETKPPARSLI